MILLLITGALIAIIVFVAFLIYTLDKRIKCPECGARMKEFFEDIPGDDEENKDCCYSIKTCSNCGKVVRKKIQDLRRYSLGFFGDPFL